MKRFKETIKFVFAILYLFHLKLFAEKPRRIVIYYHGVKKQDVPNFLRQMEYLSRKCKVVKPSEIRTKLVNGTNLLIAITLDDAFLSLIQNAIPILEKYSLPAGIFVPTGNLGQPVCWETRDGISEDSEVVMSAEQILKLDKDGFEIFSHSVSHPILTEIPHNRLRIELEKSKNFLEKIVGHEVVGISYPYGAYNDRVCVNAKKAGYKLGFTIEPSLVDSTTEDMRIGRFSVSPNDNLIKFKLKVSGAYQAVKFLELCKNLVIKRLQL